MLYQSQADINSQISWNLISNKNYMKLENLYQRLTQDYRIEDKVLDLSNNPILYKIFNETQKFTLEYRGPYRFSGCAYIE